MANVKVTFSASIKDLIDATNQVKTAIDSVAEQAAKASEMMSRFGEVAGIGISIEGIKRLVEGMAELGKHTEDMSHMLGVSTTSVQEFGYLAKLTGTDADSMALAMARFQVAITKAQNPTSQQAAALRAFGLSAKELLGLPLDQQMARFADAVSRFADGTNKTADIGLLNRALVPLIPLLDQGSAGFAKVKQHAEETAAIMTGQTIKALADLNTSLVEAKASLVGISGTLVGVFAPDLTEAINKLNEFVSTLAIMIETEYVSIDIGSRLEVLGLKTVRLVKAFEDLRNMHPMEAWKDLSIGQAAIDGLEKKINGDLAPVIAKAREQLKLLLAPPPESGGGKKQPPPADTNRGAENSARMTAMNAEITLADKQYQSDVAHINALAKFGGMTERQKTDAVRNAVNAREDAELAALNKEEAAGNLSVLQVQQIEDKKIAIYQKSYAARQKGADQSYEQEEATAKKVADSIASAFNSQLQSILSGHESFTQGMQKMFVSMIEMMLSKLITLVAEWALLNALAAATGGTGPTLMSLIMPSHAAGAWNLGQDEVASVHKGEMIVPSGPAEGLRSWMGGNSSGRWPSPVSLSQHSNASHVDNSQLSIHVNGGNAFDPRDHAREIAKAVVEHWKSNPSTRPKGW